MAKSSRQPQGPTGSKKMSQQFFLVSLCSVREVWTQSLWKSWSIQFVLMLFFCHTGLCNIASKNISCLLSIHLITVLVELKTASCHFTQLENGHFLWSQSTHDFPNGAINKPTVVEFWPCRNAIVVSTHLRNMLVKLDHLPRENG